MIFWYIDTSTHLRKTVTCSALDFISLLVPHTPPKGMQMVRYGGLYARNLKHKIAPILLAALEALRLQFPLFDIQSLLALAEHLSWRERIKASFGYDPLLCPRCGRTLERIEIWEPKRGHIWMKRGLETQRLRKAAHAAMRQLQQAHPAHYQQLAFNFDP